MVGLRRRKRRSIRRDTMPRAAEKPLRDLSEAERQHVAVLVRATSERADVRQRAVAVLAVAGGQAYTAGARRGGAARGGPAGRAGPRGNPGGVAPPQSGPR